MKPIIIISCILASGNDWQPRGHYKDWKQCGRYAKQFETRPSKPICWCHRKSYTYSYGTPIPTRKPVESN